MKVTAPPRSDQWNADDFITGPRTFTIAAVKKGKAEQPYDIELVEGEGRVWRPPMTVLRLLMAAWSDESSNWVGQRVTLYRDDNVKFGSDKVGGIRVSHITGIAEPLTVSLAVSRKSRAQFTVKPLDAAESPGVDFVSLLNDAASLADLQAAWEAVRRAGRSSDAVLVELKDKRKAALTAKQRTDLADG